MKTGQTGIGFERQRLGGVVERKLERTAAVLGFVPRSQGPQELRLAGSELRLGN